jgi:vitamin K-dependent gamma-carboxylase-like protein
MPNVRWPDAEGRVAEGRTVLGRVAAGLDRAWRPEVPAERLAAIRIAVGVFGLLYLVVRLPYWLSYARFDPAHFDPVGVVNLVLDRPLVPIAVQILTIATVIAAVPFALGWRFRVTGPLFAGLLLWTLTYRNSWGMIFHTENLLVLHAFVLGVTASADAWSLDARRRTVPVEPAARYGWPVRLLAAIVIATYVIAGIAKLRYAGSGWLWGDELRNHVAMDNLRKVLLGDISSPVAPLFLHWTWFFRAMALMTIVIEIGAPIALVGGRVAAGWALLAYGFHIGVVALMMIIFPYQLFGLAYLPFFRAERPIGAMGRWLGRRLRRV